MVLLRLILFWHVVKFNEVKFCHLDDFTFNNYSDFSLPTSCPLKKFIHFLHVNKCYGLLLSQK